MGVDLIVVFLIFVLADFINADSSFVRAIGHFEDDFSQCDVKYDKCSVDLRETTLSGPPGNKGDPGPFGPQGPRGETEEIVIFPPIEDDDYYYNEAEPGESSQNPLSTIDKATDNGIFWVSKAIYPIKVAINVELKQACLILNEFSEDKRDKNFIRHDNHSFWLSEKSNFNFDTFYGLSLAHIEWLRQQSSSVTQKIRYHCKNSYVMSEKKQNSLHMLTWNETPIGPFTTTDNPFFYKIVFNGCKDSGEDKTEWKYTDIELKSVINKNLPILDFHIRDIRGDEQMLYIELQELCFSWN